MKILGRLMTGEDEEYLVLDDLCFEAKTRSLSFKQSGHTPTYSSFGWKKQYGELSSLYITIFTTEGEKRRRERVKEKQRDKK